MEIRASQSVVLAEENQKVPAQNSAVVLAHYRTLRSEVYEPMIGELEALEADLRGAELEAVRQYRLAVEGYFAAIADQARTALAR